MSRLSTLLPAGVSRSVLGLRALLLVLPVAALAVALPTVPHLLVVALVVAGSLWWAATPDHAIGAVVVVLVAGWWAVHDVVDGRVLVVGVLLVAAHVVATVLSHGPATMDVDPALLRLWLRRGLLALVPMPVAWLAVRGLDADLAPPWMWMVAALATGILLVVTALLTRSSETA